MSGADRLDRRDPVIAELRKHAPVSLRVTLSEGDIKELAVPKAGNRWERLQRSLDGYPWVLIECMDKDKRVTAVLKREDDEGEFEETGDPDSDRDARMAKLMVDLVKSTLKEARSMFADQMRGQTELVSTMMDGLRTVQDSYTLALNVQRTTMAKDAIQGGEGDEVMKMMQMAMMLQSSKPQQRLTPTPTPTPTAPKEKP